MLQRCHTDLQKVAALDHEALNDSVELRRFVSLGYPILPADHGCSKDFNLGDCPEWDLRWQWQGAV